MSRHRRHRPKDLLSKAQERLDYRKPKPIVKIEAKPNINTLSESYNGLVTKVQTTKGVAVKSPYKVRATEKRFGVSRPPKPRSNPLKHLF